MSYLDSRLEYMVAKVRLNLEEQEKELAKAEATVEGATNIRNFMPLFFVSISFTFLTLL